MFFPSFIHPFQFIVRNNEGIDAVRPANGEIAATRVGVAAGGHGH
jgi:hypothetical protein